MAAGLFLGGVVGGVGSFIEAEQQRAQMARFRRRQRKAIQSARDFTGGTTVQGESQKGFFGARGAALAPGSIVSDSLVDEGLPEGGTFFTDPVTGERRAGGRVEEILADPLLVSARNFLQGTFDNAPDSPLAQDFVKGIRAAQASRGTFFGGSAEVAEAGGLSAFSQRLRQDLLPSLQSFGTLGESLRQGILGFEAPLRTAAATGGGGLGDASGFLGPSPFGSALTGALSGAAGGFSLDRQFGGTDSLLRLLGIGVPTTNDQLNTQTGGRRRSFLPGR